MARPCIWLHDGCLSPNDVALRSHPDAAVIFIFDEPELQRLPWSFQRLAFVLAGVKDVFQAIPNPLKELHRGDPIRLLPEFCKRHDCDRLVISDHPLPRVRHVTEAMRRVLPTTIYPFPFLTDYADEPKRFSRYWEKTARQVLGYQPRSKQRFHK